MSFARIIIEVKCQPLLWDPSHKLYRHKAARNRAWKIISRNLGKDELFLRKRWKNLKDAYRKELKRLMSKNLVESSWQYYEDLKFITEEITLGKGFRNTINTNEKNSVEQLLMKKVQKESNMDESRLDPKIMVANEKKLNVIMKSLNEIRGLIQTTNKPHEDELGHDTDYLYLVSLLPAIRKLSDIQKLYLRSKINEWLMEALSENEFLNEYDKKIEVHNEDI